MTKDKTKTPWTIHQLQRALIDDVENSSLTATERSTIEAIGGREIRLKAEEIAENRRLTSAEHAIASRYGYRGAAA